MADEEVQSPTSCGEKHGVESYVSPVASPTMSTADDSNTSSPRPNLTDNRNTPRMVRRADHLNLAQNKQVEGKAPKSDVIRAFHVVKIFRTDNDFVEVSPEQVDRVKKMHESIESGVNFSFNYNTLLFVASILAGLGLVSDSTTTVIASMLVSPIMGPVVGLAYGTTINDWKLVRLSLRNECVSLLVCVIIGAIIAACCAPTGLGQEWPTAEMGSRSTIQNLLVALPVAFFSGLGVAVSLLDSQTASLVGVAISASLLPPAVNAGVIWIYYAYVQTGYLEDPTGDDENFTNRGVISLMLTIANIFLIWIASMLMFRMKEVLPIEKKVFWDDLGVARKIYQRRALLEVVEVDGGAESKESPKDDS